jgi:hypothetical protein
MSDILDSLFLMGFFYVVLQSKDLSSVVGDTRLGLHTLQKTHCQKAERL